MGSFRLPYFADASSLPDTLPTNHDIEAAVDVINESTGRMIVGIGPHFVVKYGVHVDPLEGQTMLYLSRSMTIPVPRVYSIYQRTDNGITSTFIIMERIHGPTLHTQWSQMDNTSKSAVASQLRNIFAEMRKLDSPGGYSSVGRQGLPDGLFWTDDPSQPFAGPFDTEEELNIAMVGKYVENGLSKYKANYYNSTFASVFQGNKPTFSHGDFQRKNIILRDRVVESDIALEVVIIDWEYAGWYPDYWEYARAIFACGAWDDDWSDWVDEILVPYRNECAWVQMLLRELWS